MTLGAAARTVLVLTFVLAVRARAADPGSSPDQAHVTREIPGKHFYVGAGAQGLISRSPGLALNWVVAFEANPFVLMAEVGFGEDSTRKWDHLTLGGQLGAVLTDAMHAPYLLAGVEKSTLVDLLNDVQEGRNDLLFTAEAGYVFREPNGGPQLWLGLRGLFPITSVLNRLPPPNLPFATIVVRFWL